MRTLVLVSFAPAATAVNQMMAVDRRSKALWKIVGTKMSAVALMQRPRSDLEEQGTDLSTMDARSEMELERRTAPTLVDRRMMLIRMFTVKGRTSIEQAGGKRWPDKVRLATHRVFPSTSQRIMYPSVCPYPARDVYLPLSINVSLLSLLFSLSSAPLSRFSNGSSSPPSSPAPPSPAKDPCLLSPPSSPERLGLRRDENESRIWSGREDARSSSTSAYRSRRSSDGAENRNEVR